MRRDPTFSRFHTIPECDRQTHTHTHTHTHRHTTTAYTALSIASRGKNSFSCSLSPHVLYNIFGRAHPPSQLSRQTALSLPIRGPIHIFYHLRPQSVNYPAVNCNHAIKPQSFTVAAIAHKPICCLLYTNRPIQYSHMHSSLLNAIPPLPACNTTSYTQPT